MNRADHQRRLTRMDRLRAKGASAAMPEIALELTPELEAAIVAAEAATGKPFAEITQHDLPAFEAVALADALLRAPRLEEK